MPTHNTYIYILIMALVTYLVRVLPLTLIRKEIKNITVKSFLYYVPYVTLAIMTFPAILSATSSIISAAIALNRRQPLKLKAGGGFYQHILSYKSFIL